MVDPPEVHPGPCTALRTMHVDGAGDLHLQANQEARGREDPPYGGGLQALSVSTLTVDQFRTRTLTPDHPTTQSKEKGG